MAGIPKESIYQMIELEREKQDLNWPRTPDHPHREQYHFNAPHILLLEEKVSRLRSMWYAAKKEELQAEYVKVAAIAIRALEEIDK